MKTAPVKIRHVTPRMQIMVGLILFGLSGFAFAPWAMAANHTRADSKKQPEVHHTQSDRISLSFQHIDIRSALQILADTVGVNIVVADEVSGTIALHLDNVPWRQALDTILRSKGLGMEHHGNVIMVAPVETLASRQQAMISLHTARGERTPVQSRIIQVNYARAEDIARILRDQRTAISTSSNPKTGIITKTIKSGTDTVASLLSPRGHIAVDDRTNSLLITDTRSRLDRIQGLVRRLDVPVKQVLIQARIVVANRDFTRNLGMSQSLETRGALSDHYHYNLGYAVKLPAVNATSALATSIISDTLRLNLELSAMESENNGEIISSPRIITANGQEATIEQGSEVPYQQGSDGSLAGTSVEFKKAVLSLHVTPHITPDNNVIMGLDITQDTVGDYIPTSEGGVVPSINTRSLNTQVLVADGNTVVLGGIFERTNRDKTNAVPYLSQIPFIGALFKGTEHERHKRELLIFITPRILDHHATSPPVNPSGKPAMSSS